MTIYSENLNRLRGSIAECMCIDPFIFPDQSNSLLFSGDEKKKGWITSILKIRETKSYAGALTIIAGKMVFRKTIFKLCSSSVYWQSLYCGSPVLPHHVNVQVRFSVGEWKYKHFQFFRKVFMLIVFSTIWGLLRGDGQRY